MIQEKYEQAIKETFNYLDEAVVYQKEKYSKVGLLKEEIIERTMKKQGFDVYCTYNHDRSVICVYPTQSNLPIHIWRE